MLLLTKLKVYCDQSVKGTESVPSNDNCQLT